ncbi:hypothetical protein ACTQ5K_12300 [Niallia sp. Sow4_A1]|uniref:ATP synthase F0 subunit 8 n=1 Tax=Niallia hominis TaxID=3133173 RepID=A0ABV1F4K2_9BACI|nr:MULTISPECIES: hypothetical protein [Bacillaceae]MCM3364133.1 hypothetical protein [Niallia sp. MER TA 168]CAI9396408.1 hypothetical protein BACSP_01191 [Bacillus sp. T2.9-1]
MRKILITIGIVLYAVLFSFLYKLQLGSIGFFLLSLLFFKLAKKKQSDQNKVEKEKKNFYFKEKLNKP